MQKITLKKIEIPIYVALDDGDSVYIDEESLVEYTKLVFEVNTITKIIENEIKKQKNFPDNVIPFPRKR